MAFKNFVTAHCHPSSLDTASTPEAFANRELELGTGYTTCTDHGTLNAAWTCYNLAKKKGLTPIVGLEAYLRDDSCEILTKAGVTKDKDGTFKDYSKYFHLTMHFLDEEAYETGVRLLSAADSRAERHGSERKPLFTWQDIEELGGKNVTMTSSCLVGVVQRHLLDHNSIENAIAYYEKLRGCCKPGNWYVEVFPHKCDKNWDSTGIIIYDNGERERIPLWKKLRFQKGEGKVQEYARYWKPGRVEILVAVMDNRKWVDRPPRNVIGIEILEDFILNECRPWAPNSDVQEGANKAVLWLANHYGDPVLIGDDSHYTHTEEKIVQDIRLQSHGGSWRFYGSYHRQDSAEAFKHFQQTLGTSESQFQEWVENSYAWAERFKGFSFRARKSLPTKFYPEDTLRHTMELIQKHGRMHWDDPVWVDRLQKELTLLHKNGKIDLLPYFFLGEEVCELYAKNRCLTGSGRGSAAGLLLTYLLRITHVNPLEYNLSMDRFLTKSRILSGKLPDIDMDFSSRDLIFKPNEGWLDTRFPGHYARISTDTSLKLRSAVKDVARVRHDKRVPEDIEMLTKQFLQGPQGIEDRDFVFGYQGSDGWVEGSIKRDKALQTYIARYPDEWEIVQQTLGLSRQKSVHACGTVITNEPISNFIPTTSVGGVTVTQYTAASVEAVGGLKMDFLSVNSVGDIELALQIIKRRQLEKISGDKSEQAQTLRELLSGDSVTIDGEKVLSHELLVHEGKPYAIWKLPTDYSVYNDICEGRTETVFQFDTDSVQGWLKLFNETKEEFPDGTQIKLLDSIGALSAFTALDRPGPLDYFVTDSKGDTHNMLVEYAIRSKEGERTENLPILDKMLPETYGIIVFQEQLQRVFQVVGQTTAEQADEFRVHISKKKMALVIKDKDIFMPGAIKTLGNEEDANRLWQSMETFGQYCFNASHSTCYVIISYACAFLKHHYPLEWWSAVLSRAKKEDIYDKFWPHCGHLIDLPDVSLSGENFEIRGERIRAPLNLLHGIGPAAHTQLTKYAPYSSLTDFVEKIKQHQIETSEKVIKQKKVKVKTFLRKEGKKKIYDVKEEIQDVETIKKGRNALHKGVTTQMIIGGAMDSLFEPGTLPLDALKQYNDVWQKVFEEKAPGKIDEKYLVLNPLVKYQMQKLVLPPYRKPLLPILGRMNSPGFIMKLNRPMFKFGDEVYPFEMTERILKIDGVEPWEHGMCLNWVAVGYVQDARVFSYRDGREAIEIILQADSLNSTSVQTIKAVKWGGAHKLPEHLSSAEALKGSIAVVLYSKYSTSHFVIENLQVIQPPLGK